MPGRLIIEKSIRETLNLSSLQLSSQAEARLLARNINEVLNPATPVRAGELYLTAMLIEFYTLAVSEYMSALRKEFAPVTLRDMILPGAESAWKSLLSRMDENYPAERQFDLSTDPLILEKRLSEILILRLLNSNRGLPKIKLPFI